MKLPNWIDLIVITLLFKGCYTGFGRGFLTELLQLAGLMAATVVAINFHGPAAQWLSPLFWLGQQVGTFITFLVIFLTVLVVVSVGMRVLGRLLKWERLHWTVQGLGMLLGGLRGLWAGGLVVVMLSASGFAYLRESVEKESIIGRQLNERAMAVFMRVSAMAPGGAARDPRLVPRAR